MEWNEKQIFETLRLIEQSDYDEIKLETGNFKLHVIKSGIPPGGETSAGLAPDRDVPAVAPAGPVSLNEPPVEPATPAADEEEAAPEGMVFIRAPMLGTFYRAPAPGLPAFVEVGANVKPDDTVCLIEVMKLFSSIKAGVSGKVTRIPAQNGATVKNNQVLLIVKSDRG